MPIFIEKKSEFDSALEMMNQELQAHPDLILVKQKIKAAEEIRNKKIDQVEDGSGLMKCFE
jgi:DNA-directed RNA polymerase